MCAGGQAEGLDKLGFIKPATLPYRRLSSGLQWKCRCFASENNLKGEPERRVQASAEPERRPCPELELSSARCWCWRWLLCVCLLGACCAFRSSHNPS